MMPKDEEIPKSIRKNPAFLNVYKMGVIAGKKHYKERIRKAIEEAEEGKIKVEKINRDASASLYYISKIEVLNSLLKEVEVTPHP